MADRRKGKKKKESEARGEEDKASPLEYEVAKYMRNKLPQKRAMFIGHKVDYFVSSKAVDCLLDSKWATNKDKQPALFTTRDSVVDYLEVMLRHKFFHRARKIIIKNDPKKKKDDKDKDKDKEVESSAAEDKDKKGKKKKTTIAGEESAKEEGTGKEEGKREKKKDKKIKLDMHLEQVVVDGSEPYVWIYDPIPLRTWFFGMGLVVAAIAICLFPLWPRVVRNYVYYLSIAAAGFLFFIIGLAILRLIVFCLVWAASFGKHHLWLLPNLTEDVGFVQSFIPLYQYEYMGEKDGTKKKDEDKKETEAKPSKKKKKPDDSGGESDSKADKTESDSQKDKGSEDESSNGSRTPANGSDNGFEMLDVEPEARDQQQTASATTVN